MKVDITLKNYRCFPDEQAATFSLRSGFTGFVGPNNCGKSLILRFFYDFRHLFHVVSHRSGFQPDNLSFNHQSAIQEARELANNKNDRPINIELDFGSAPSGASARLSLTIQRDSNAFSVTFSPDLQTSDWEWFAGRCKILGDNMYIGAFRNAINVGTRDDYFDISVGQGFVQKWRDLKSGPGKEHNEAAHRLTEDLRKIFKFTTFDINASPDVHTLQLIINGKSYRLDEVGSGLAQFIIVLANVATRKPALLLIDEPELNLHPRLQLDFLTTLGSYSQESVLFASHNIGLVRTAADWIYSVAKLDEGVSTVTPFEDTPDLSEFLGELSFAGYRELGYDKVLFVEGRTDIKTAQQLLRLYHKEHEIVCLSLGGSDMINAAAAHELEEIKRLSDNISVLIDSERTKAGEALRPDRAAFEEACKKAGIDCRVLERRALENYLTDEAVKHVKGDNYRALEPYESRGSVEPMWGKVENWRIAREMKREDIEGTDLGAFLKSL